MVKEILETIQEIAGDDIEFILDLVQSFEDTTPDLLAQIEDGFHRNDIDTMGKAAHSLKSSSAMMGCFTFSARCADMELACKAGTTDPATLSELKDALQEAYRPVEAAMKSLLRQLNSAPAAPAPTTRSGFGQNA